MIGLRISTTSVVRKSLLESGPLPECPPYDNCSLRLTLVGQKYIQALSESFGRKEG